MRTQFTKAEISGMILDLLRQPEPHRHLYRGRDGNWYVSYGGGKVSAEVAQAVIASGEVNSVYSDCPNDSYHVGRTLDVVATTAIRKTPGNRDTKVYL